MTFGNPLLLWLLVPVAALALADALGRTAARRTWPQIFRVRAHLAGFAPLPGEQARTVRWRLCLGLALLVGALASPRAGYVRQPLDQAPREVVVALDLSRSMLARDVRPSRLDHAKLLTSALLERSAGDRLGLVLFSASAYLQLPLSDDYQIFAEMLPDLSPDYFPQSGTNYTAMLTASLGAFSQTGDAERFLVVLSDGEAFDPDWRAAQAELAKRGIRVVGIGIGTSGGDLMPTDAGLVRDARGAEAVSRLRSATLEELAKATGGTFAAGNSWIDIAALLKTPPAPDAKKNVTYKVDPSRLVERYHWLALPALLLLAWSFWCELPVRPSTREVRRASTAPRNNAPGLRRLGNAAALFAVAALVVVTSSLHSQDLAEQDVEGEQDENSPLRSLAALVSQRITGMLAKPEPGAEDCVSLVIDIIAYCDNTLRARQRFPISIIDDANRAIDWGERLDPRGGNWPQLRRDLQALLKAVQEPWQTTRPDAAGKAEMALGYDPLSEMKEDKHSAGLRGADPSQAGELENAKNNFAAQSAFGEMNDGAAKPSQDAGLPPVASDQQVVGGRKTAADEEREEHPELVLPLQRLEHVRRSDTPAKLFQMLDGKRPSTVSQLPAW